LDLPEKFFAAIAFIGDFGESKLANSNEIVLDALMLRVVEGKNTRPVPDDSQSPTYSEDMATWVAWKELDNKTEIEAMDMYVKTLEQFHPMWWLESTDHNDPREAAELKFAATEAAILFAGGPGELEQAQAHVESVTAAGKEANHTYQTMLRKAKYTAETIKTESAPATCAKEALARLVSRLTVMTIELMIYLEKQEHGSAVDLKQMTAACSARLEAQEEQARQDSRERLKHLLRERSKQRASERAGERSSERASLRGALAAGNRASDDRLAAPPAGDDRRTKWMQDGKTLGWGLKQQDEEREKERLLWDFDHVWKSKMDMWTKDIEQKLNQNHQDRLKADIEKHLARKQEEEERLKSEQLMRSGIVGGIMSIFSTKEAEENAKKYDDMRRKLMITSERSDEEARVSAYEEERARALRDLHVKKLSERVRLFGEMVQQREAIRQAKFVVPPVLPALRDLKKSASPEQRNTAQKSKDLTISTKQLMLQQKGDSKQDTNSEVGLDHGVEKSMSVHPENKIASELPIYNQQIRRELARIHHSVRPLEPAIPGQEVSNFATFKMKKPSWAQAL